MADDDGKPIGVKPEAGAVGDGAVSEPVVIPVDDKAVKSRVKCELCTPPRDIDSYAIFRHVRDIHKGYRYTRSGDNHFIPDKRRGGPGPVQGGPKVSIPDIEVISKSEAETKKPKKKYNLNIGLELNVQIVDGIGKLAGAEKDFKFSDADLKTLKECYDDMGGALSVEDPRAAIVIINAKVVGPGLLFNWDTFSANIKKKFAGIFKRFKFESALDRQLAKREGGAPPPGTPPQGPGWTQP